MWLKKTVAVVLPAGKNSRSIFNVIQELDATSYVDEIVVVDNGVDAETLSQVKKTRARFVKQKKRGVGRAIRTGIKNTKAGLIIVTEPNGTFKAEDIFKLLSYSEDFDIVFGTRTHVPLIAKGSGMTFLRRLIDDLFGKIISILFLSSNLTDVGCTLRLTNRKGWRKVVRECHSNGEIMLTQWLIAAAEKKVRFIEIPVNFIAAKTPSQNDSFIKLATRGLKVFYCIIAKWSAHILDT